MFFYVIIINFSIILISSKYLLLNEESFILVSFILFYIYTFKFISPIFSNNIDFEIKNIKDSLGKTFFKFKNQILIINNNIKINSTNRQIIFCNLLVINSIREIVNYKFFNFLGIQRNYDYIKLVFINKIEKNLIKLIKIYIYNEFIGFIKIKNYANIKKYFNNYSYKKNLLENQEFIHKI
uniref:Ymf39 n=1 Tax=Pulvinaster venetus TaxID=427767 RepID=UPI001FCD00AF|nr:Ymf39 [Pulvinaster venetus]UNJ18969.1 Ymf39 [Pulvinaster venetus]